MDALSNAALALTWSDLERSKSRSRIFRRAVTWKRSQIGPCYFFPLSNSILPYSLSLSPNQIRVRDGIANWAPGPVASSSSSSSSSSRKTILNFGLVFKISQ